MKENEDTPLTIDYNNPHFRKALSIAGGIESLARNTRKRGEKYNEGIEVQAARLSEKISKGMTSEEAAKAQDAFHGSSRLLAYNHLKKRGELGNSSREEIVINGTNVFDTSLDYASKRWPIPEHVKEQLKKKK